jgi:pSer/pThr/pTyr-binding forkhead associated (FHA) protein
MTDDVSLLPLLTVVFGPMQGASFRLRRDTCLIGRDDGVDILIEDFRVSRRHAVVQRSADRLMITDAGSTNGTWLNDQRLHGTAELSDGDRIRVGSVELRFYDPSSASTDPGGAMRYTMLPPVPAQPPPGPRDPANALLGPTQAVTTSRKVAAPWVAIVTALVIAAGAAWALLAS